jgi:hypothetical protein
MLLAVLLLGAAAESLLPEEFIVAAGLFSNSDSV